MNRRVLLTSIGVLALSAPFAAAADKTPPHQAGRVHPKERPTGDKAIIRTAADAMGFVRGMGANETTNTINRVQMRGAGKVWINGVAYQAPKYIYTMSLHLKAAREDIQRAGKDNPSRIVRVVLDQEAWDEAAPGVDGRPTTDSAKNRRLQLARNPFGFTRAMVTAAPASIKVEDGGPKGKIAISFPVDGVTTTAVLDAWYRPESITQTVDGKVIVAKFDKYRDLSEYGLMFPTVWTETVDGKPSLDLKIDDGRVASYAVFPKPASLAAR